MFDASAIYAQPGAAGAVSTLPYGAGYVQPAPSMQTLVYTEPSPAEESTWGFSDVAMLAVAGGVIGAAIGQRSMGRTASTAAEPDVEAALIAAPAITARAPAVQMAAAAKKRPVKRAVAKKPLPVKGSFQEGDIGVTPPLGVYDPLGLIATKDMRRYEIMEIKHGRAAMLGFLHIILIHAGVRLPGYLSIQQDLKFADMPVGCFDSLEATPTLGWLQIMAVTCAAETGYAGTNSGLVKQTADKAPGDIGGSKWKRYADPEERAFKLNAERNNGRAAMLGVTGCLIHELLGVDALYPTGGLGGAAPPTIF
jgi:hypothetical protein